MLSIKDKLHWEIDVRLFDGANILDLAGPVQAFKSTLIAKKSAYGLCFVSVERQATRACCRLSLTTNAKAELSQAQSKTRRDLLVPSGGLFRRLIPGQFWRVRPQTFSPSSYGI